MRKLFRPGFHPRGPSSPDLRDSEMGIERRLAGMLNSVLYGHLANAIRLRIDLALFTGKTGFWKIVNTSGVIVNWSLKHSTSHGDGEADAVTLKASQVEVDELGTATYDDVQDYINQFADRTHITGMVISDSGSGEIDVSAGTGLCKVSDDINAAVKFFDFAGKLNQALTDLSINYIYLDYKGGAPEIVVDTTGALLYDYDHIILGCVFRNGTAVHFINSQWAGLDTAHRVKMHAYEHTGAHRSSGIVTSSTGTRQLSITQGIIWVGLTRILVSAIDTSGAGTFSYWYYDGDLGPAAWVEVTGQTQISRTQYNALATGLANLGTNRYGVHWVYLDWEGDHMHVVYGQGNYTAAQAEQAGIPSSLPPIVANFGILIAKIICQEGTDVLTITYPWTTTFQSSLAADHGSLAGLGDDDHTQYLKTAVWGRGCRVRRSTDQSIPNSTNTVIIFDTEDFDNDTMWEGVTNPQNITIRTAGIYLINAEVHWETALGSNFYRIIYINHSGDGILSQSLFYGSTVGTLRLYMPTSVVYSCAIGDVLTLSVYQNTGGAIDAEADGYQASVMSAVRIGP